MRGKYHKKVCDGAIVTQGAEIIKTSFDRSETLVHRAR